MLNMSWEEGGATQRAPGGEMMGRRGAESQGESPNGFGEIETIIQSSFLLKDSWVYLLSGK